MKTGTITFTDFDVAYALMNQWSGVVTSYETQFRYKNVTKIDISFKGEKPQLASVYYNNGDCIGVDCVDLTSRL
jgi:hypothetical protein